MGCSFAARDAPGARLIGDIGRPDREMHCSILSRDPLNQNGKDAFFGA